MRLIRILTVNVGHHVWLFGNSLHKDTLRFGVYCWHMLAVWLLLVVVKACLHSFVSWLLHIYFWGEPLLGVAYLLIVSQKQI